MLKKYDKGTAIYILAHMYNVSAELTDPSPVTVSIHDPSGTAKKTDQAMSKIETGKYCYVWQSSGTDATGKYTVTIKATKDTYISINKLILFELE